MRRGLQYSSIFHNKWGRLNNTISSQLSVMLVVSFDHA